jgi:hypothetical protein
MFTRKLIMQIVSALAAYFGLTWAGYNGSEPTEVGAGISINPDMIKYIFTALAAFLPQLADRFVPGLGAILSKVLDALLGKPKTADGEPETALTTTRKVDPFREDMDAFKLLADRHGGNEAARPVLAQMLETITTYHVYGKGTDVQKAIGQS